jgi:HlyD family secretion protein
MTRKRAGFAAMASMGVLALAGCLKKSDDGVPRSSGYVEATEVQVSSKVAGRVDEVHLTEGAKVTAGEVLVKLSTTDTDLAIDRAKAQRATAEAEVRLLRAGARPEDIQQATAQVASAEAEIRAAQADLESARADEARYQQLLDRKAGAAKPRDDARTRREMATARLDGLRDRVAAVNATLARLKAGSRAEEIDMARTRVAAADAEIAAVSQRRIDAVIASPGAGVVVSRLVEPGELVAIGAPVAMVLDLDHAWVNAYVEEPLVPQLRIGQSGSIVTDAGDRLIGTIAFVAPRAEFTPRNVQTASERARLVYRVKVTVDNRQGVLKPGMPVEVEWQK